MQGGDTSYAVGLFNEYANAAGHKHQGQVDGFADLHGRETYTHHFKALNGVSYLAQISPAADYGLITAHYNVLTDIQNELSDDELENLAKSEQGYREHEEESIERIGARALLLQCDENDLKSANRDVVKILNNSETVYSVNRTEKEKALYHIFIHQRVFPNYDSFSPDRFNEAVRKVTYYRQQAVSEYFNHIELPLEDNPPEQRESGGERLVRDLSSD